jgi:two-component system, sensor histidine kinase PdtaS
MEIGFTSEILYLAIIGILVIVLLSVQKILRRKYTQQARRLNESEEFYRRILDTSPDGIVQTGLDGTVTFCSEQFLRIAGVSARKEIIGRNALDFIVAEEREAAQKNLEETLRNGSSPLIEYRTYRPDGSIFFIELSASVLYDQGRKPKGFIGVIRDITAEKLLERNNEERRLYLEGILKSIPSALVTLDREHRIIDWSPAAQELFHYRQDEVSGKNLDEVISGGRPEIMEEAFSLTRRLPEQKVIGPVETIRYTKEGRPLDVMVSAAAITRDSSLIGYIGSYTDISGMKLTQKELEEKNREVERLLREKELLLKEVHHRIKNQMNTMYGLLSLQSSKFEDEALKRAFDEAKNRIRLMQSIYQRLYTEDDVDIIRLKPFIEELLHELHYSTRVLESLHIENDIDDISVTAKQALPIGIIINELVTNSLKYAYQTVPQNGFSSSRAPEIRVEVRQHGPKQLELLVVDNGGGMPAKIIEEHDFGFGLSLVETYAKQYYGTLDIQASETGGTKIRLELKLEKI